MFISWVSLTDSLPHAVPTIISYLGVLISFWEVLQEELNIHGGNYIESNVL